jgi:two-component system phosphate regulon response regulator PhoB
MDAPRTVLVADDDERVRALVVMALARGRFTVVEAAAGDEALAVARRNPPDLAVLDLMMPGLNGVEVCRALRADPATAATRVIILTGMIGSAERDRALAAGADAYVTKPSSPVALLDLVRVLLLPRAR